MSTPYRILPLPAAPLAYRLAIGSALPSPYALSLLFQRALERENEDAKLALKSAGGRDASGVWNVC